MSCENPSLESPFGQVHPADASESWDEPQKRGEVAEFPWMRK